MAFFSLNVEAPTPAQAAPLASLGADSKARVAYSGVHHHAGRADAVDRALAAVGARSSATRTTVSDNRRIEAILRPHATKRKNSAAILA
jgi:hypothetical protein